MIVQQINQIEQAARKLMSNDEAMERIVPGITTQSPEEARIRVNFLIEASRQRALAQHWTYDHNRHVALKQLARALELKHETTK